MSNILTNLLKETSPSRLLRIVLTDFQSFFCYMQYMPAWPPNLVF